MPMFERQGAGLTLTMTHQTEERTKVKLRFDNVYYPRTVEELYKRVWDAVDKQICLDRATDQRGCREISCLPAMQAPANGRDPPVDSLP